MNRKPDLIRSMVLIFMVGLVISGFTQLGTTGDASPEVLSTGLSTGLNYGIAADSSWRKEEAQEL